MRAVLYRRRNWQDGRCPDQGTVPDRVSEENWFFRLSRYTAQLRGLIASGTIRIEPAERRNEVLALIDGGLRGLLRLPQHRARPRLGHPGPRRPRPGDLRAVGRARQLPRSTGLRRRRREPHPLVDRRVADAYTCSARGCSGSTPSTGPRCCCPRVEAVPTDIAVTATSPRTAARSASPAAPPSTPTTSSRPSGTDAVALVPVARGAPERGRRLHHRPPRQPGQRRARQRLRQPRQPGRHHDPPLPRRASPGHGGQRTRRGRSRTEPSAKAPGLIAEALEDFDFRCHRACGNRDDAATRARPGIWQGRTGG